MARIGLKFRTDLLSMRDGELQARLEARDQRIAALLDLKLRMERRNVAKIRARAESRDVREDDVR